MSDVISTTLDILKFLGANPEHLGGWIAAILVFSFMIWRLSIADKKFDEYNNKVTQVMVQQEKEWRDLIAKTDEMTFVVMKDSVNSMTLLSEKINTLQLLLLQYTKR